MRYGAANRAQDRAMGESPVEHTSTSITVTPESQAHVEIDMDQDLPACYNGTCAVNEWQGFAGSDLTNAKEICSMASGRYAESNCPRLALTATGVELSPSPAELPAPQLPQAIDQEARQ